MRPNDQIVTALLSSKANPASQADACAWSACTFCHCMDMSLLDMDSCWRLPWILFNQSLRDYWHVSKFPVVRASRWPTSPQHHLQVTIVSTTKDQALSGVRHGCRDSVGPHRGKEGFFGFSGLSEYPLRCDYRLCRSAKSIQVVWSRF